jgi:cytochrome P450
MYTQYFTFDVIGYLAFAEDFDCLRSERMHPWIDTMTKLLSGGDWRRAADRIPIMKPLIKLATPGWAIEGYRMHITLMKKKARYRLNLKTDRLDFMTRMASSESGLQEHQFIASADTVILGGSETTSTLLSGCTYLLLKNPDKMAKLTHEIRSNFNSEDEIDLAAVNSLSYMLACLDETFRLYPPVAGSLPRRTIHDDVIAGNPVPPGVRALSSAIPCYSNQATLTLPRQRSPSINGASTDDQIIGTAWTSTFPSAGWAMPNLRTTTRPLCSLSAQERVIALGESTYD